MSSTHSHGSPTASISSSSAGGCSARPNRCPFCLGPVCPVEEHQGLHVRYCQVDERGEVKEVCAECGKVHPGDIEDERYYDPTAWEGEGVGKSPINTSH